jgi:hypothetical protein
MISHTGEIASSTKSKKSISIEFPSLLPVSNVAGTPLEPQHHEVHSQVDARKQIQENNERWRYQHQVQGLRGNC